MILRIAAAVFIATMVAGCSSKAVVKKPMEGTLKDGNIQFSSVQIVDKTENSVPDHFLDAINGYVKSELRKCHMLADANSAPYKVEIAVTDYRMRSGFSRMMFGVMAGKDGVSSSVKVIEASSGQSLGESQVKTYNMTAVGTEEDVARMHGTKIAQWLSERK